MNGHDLPHILNIVQQNRKHWSWQCFQCTFPVCTEPASRRTPRSCPSSCLKGIMSQACIARTWPRVSLLSTPFCSGIDYNQETRSKAWLKNSNGGLHNLMPTTLEDWDALNLKCLSWWVMTSASPKGSLIWGYQGTPVPVRIQDCLLWMDILVEVKFDHRMVLKNKIQDNLQR